MSLVRVHNFAISLDGFGTGEGQSAEAQFGHAGDRLHEWMFVTRWWDPGGSSGVDDDAFVQRFGSSCQPGWPNFPAPMISAPIPGSAGTCASAEAPP